MADLPRGPNMAAERGGGGHRASCHRCGNMRKAAVRCAKCPHIHCQRCAEKMVMEWGTDVFDGGCPVCKGYCCCHDRRSAPTCNRLYHCYKKCPGCKNRGLTGVGDAASADSTKTPVVSLARAEAVVKALLEAAGGAVGAPAPVSAKSNGSSSSSVRYRPAAAALTAADATASAAHPAAHHGGYWPGVEPAGSAASQRRAHRAAHEIDAAVAAAAGSGAQRDAASDGFAGDAVDDGSGPSSRRYGTRGKRRRYAELAGDSEEEDDGTQGDAAGDSASAGGTSAGAGGDGALSRRGGGWRVHAAAPPQLAHDGATWDQGVSEAGDGDSSDDGQVHDLLLGSSGSSGTSDESDGESSAARDTRSGGSDVPSRRGIASSGSALDRQRRSRATAVAAQSHHEYADAAVGSKRKRAGAAEVGGSDGDHAGLLGRAAGAGSEGLAAAPHTVESMRITWALPAPLPSPPLAPAPPSVGYSGRVGNGGPAVDAGAPLSRLWQLDRAAEAPAASGGTSAATWHVAPAPRHPEQVPASRGGRYNNDATMTTHRTRRTGEKPGLGSLQAPFPVYGEDAGAGGAGGDSDTTAIAPQGLSRAPSIGSHASDLTALLVPGTHVLDRGGAGGAPGPSPSLHGDETTSFLGSTTSDTLPATARRGALLHLGADKRPASSYGDGPERLARDTAVRDDEAARRAANGTTDPDDSMPAPAQWYGQHAVTAGARDVHGKGVQRGGLQHSPVGQARSSGRGYAASLAGSDGPGSGISMSRSPITAYRVRQDSFGGDVLPPELGAAMRPGGGPRSATASAISAGADGYSQPYAGQASTAAYGRGQLRLLPPQQPPPTDGPPSDGYHGGWDGARYAGGVDGPPAAGVVSVGGHVPTPSSSAAQRDYIVMLQQAEHRSAIAAASQGARGAAGVSGGGDTATPRDAMVASYLTASINAPHNVFVLPPDVAATAGLSTHTNVTYSAGGAPTSSRTSDATAIPPLGHGPAAVTGLLQSLSAAWSPLPSPSILVSQPHIPQRPLGIPHVLPQYPPLLSHGGHPETAAAGSAVARPTSPASTASDASETGANLISRPGNVTRAAADEAGGTDGSSGNMAPAVHGTAPGMMARPGNDSFALMLDGAPPAPAARGGGLSAPASSDGALAATRVPSIATYAEGAYGRGATLPPMAPGAVTALLSPASTFLRPPGSLLSPPPHNPLPPPLGHVRTADDSGTAIGVDVCGAVYASRPPTSDATATVSTIASATAPAADVGQLSLQSVGRDISSGVDGGMAGRGPMAAPAAQVKVGAPLPRPGEPVVPVGEAFPL